jgi:AraC-like DNA-binding protein
MRKITFSSDQLPAHLDDRARLAAWHDACAPISSSDASYLPDRPFFMRVAFTHSNGVKVIQWDGTLARTRRTSGHIAADGVHDLAVSFNVSPHPWTALQRGEETVVNGGTPLVHSQGEPLDFRVKGPTAMVGVMVPLEQLRSLSNAADLVGQTLDANAAPVRHLRRYLELILGPGGIGTDAALDEHFGRTLLDLVALALGASRDARELAGMRGLRAARLRAALNEIRDNFTDPGFSPQQVALKLGLSARYVQDLLHETGKNFTERVLELRLQRARAMLAAAQYDGLKVIEIAGLCGFNEASYFNRRFRARFGASPTQFRGRSDDAGA